MPRSADERRPLRRQARGTNLPATPTELPCNPTHANASRLEQLAWVVLDEVRLTHGRLEWHPFLDEQASCVIDHCRPCRVSALIDAKPHARTYLDVGSASRRRQPKKRLMNVLKTAWLKRTERPM